MPDSSSQNHSLNGDLGRDPDMPDDALGLGLAPAETMAVSSAAVASSTGAAYRVLARKYRPQNFAELIGQDAMVQTLGNAIKRGRLAHAFLMTGVRGVGKTSTARLIAKALNCIGVDGQGGATIDPCGACDPCSAIAEGRHIDVIEMDAASHTGVDDVREIIEAVRYAAVSARYKIYIIDEVHMLSKNAFNALLKTLEEPPAHVKFLFATTEVNKVPITVLSRCQRFDLKRITAALLAKHFTEILAKEQVAAEPEALSLIATAAEGSARDGLSILDQAIAHADSEGDGMVTANQVRDMLGLSDRGAVRRLFTLLLSGDAQSMLAEARSQYVLGVEPLAMMSGLLAEVHRLTLAKIGAPHDAGLDEEGRQAVDDHSDQLSFPVLHRLWQLLLKGHDEVSKAAMPLECSDMALLRVIHGASLPDPGELARLLENGGASVNSLSSPGAASSSASNPDRHPAASGKVNGPQDFLAMLHVLATHNYFTLESTLREVVRVVSYAPPRVEFQLAGPVLPSFIADWRDAVYKITGARWELVEADGNAQPSIAEIEAAQQQQANDAILHSPLVQAARAAFPQSSVYFDGKIVDAAPSEPVRSISA